MAKDKELPKKFIGGDDEAEATIRYHEKMRKDKKGKKPGEPPPTDKPSTRGKPPGK